MAVLQGAAPVSGPGRAVRRLRLRDRRQQGGRRPAPVQPARRSWSRSSPSRPSRRRRPRSTRWPTVDVGVGRCNCSNRLPARMREVLMLRAAGAERRRGRRARRDDRERGPGGPAPGRGQAAADPRGVRRARETVRLSVPASPTSPEPRLRSAARRDYDEAFPSSPRKVDLVSPTSGDLSAAGVPHPFETLGLTFDDVLLQPAESDVIPSAGGHRVPGVQADHRQGAADLLADGHRDRGPDGGRDRPPGRPRASSTATSRSRTRPIRSTWSSGPRPA